MKGTKRVVFNRSADVLTLTSHNIIQDTQKKIDRYFLTPYTIGGSRARYILSKQFGGRATFGRYF